MMKSDLKVPFDIYDVRTIPFDIDLEKATNAKKMLEDQIKAIKNGNFKPLNTITSAKTYSTIQKMADEGAQIELSDVSKVFLNSFSEFSSMISEMKSEIYELKTSLSLPTFRNDEELMKRINLLENTRDGFKKRFNELKNNNAPKHELKEYELMIASIDSQLDHLERQLF